MELLMNLLVIEIKHIFNRIRSHIELLRVATLTNISLELSMTTNDLRSKLIIVKLSTLTLLS